jgi:hypothetical protein
VSGERIDPHPVLGCDVCLSGLLQTISLELPRRPLPAGEFICGTRGGANNQPESVAGPSGGTAGPSGGTVTALAKENCRELSLSRDRKGHLEAVICPTTGTHKIYQMGAGVEEAGGQAKASSGSLSGGHRHAS